MSFIFAMFPIAHIAVLIMSLHSFIKHFSLYLVHGRAEDREEYRENFIFFILALMLGLVYFI